MLLARTSSALILACIAVAAVGAGCADETGPAGDRTARPDLRGLPTHQLLLGYTLCPDEVEARRGSVRRKRARARAGLERLLRAFRKHPQAEVDTTYWLAEDAGTRHERITLREYIEIEISGAREVIEGGDSAARRCARQLARRLRSALEARPA